MKRPCFLALVAGAAACSGGGAPDRDQPAANREASQRWSSSNCADAGLDTFLHADGTYEEAGGRGRWSISDDALHIRGIAPPTVTFMSAYPELMALDEDGRLPLTAPQEVEAKAGELTKRFRRCR